MANFKMDKGPAEVLRALFTGTREEQAEALSFQGEAFRARLGCYPEELKPVEDDPLCLHCGEPIAFEPIYRDGKSPNPSRWHHRTGPFTCNVAPEDPTEPWPIATPRSTQDGRRRELVHLHPRNEPCNHPRRVWIPDPVFGSSGEGCWKCPGHKEVDPEPGEG